jgi:hypothetical protein
VSRFWASAYCCAMQLRRVVMVVVAALAVVLVIVGVLVVTRSGDDTASKKPGTGFVEPTNSPSPSPAKQAAQAPSCPDVVARSFEPTSINVTGVARGITVIAPHRDAHGVPGVPPLSDSGKHVFAFDPDQRVEPGDPNGNVLLNAHTWPDGSALGNQLLAGLHRDGRIVVQGQRPAQKLCYRVTRRVEVLASAGAPGYYSRTGTPQLAIVVCSGRRLGPGQWEKRTIWYASPST